MVKSFAIAALVFASLSGQPISGQSNYADIVRNARATESAASPEAKAEAKRLYKEGVKYGLAGLYPQAIQILERAVKLDPQLADAHFALGHAYFDYKQWKNAVESFERAVELNPKDRDAQNRLSLARTMAHGGSERLVRPSERVSEPVSVQVSLDGEPAAETKPANRELAKSESPKRKPTPPLMKLR